MRIILHLVTLTYAPCSLVNEEFNRAVRVTCPDRGCRPWRRFCRRCTATLRSTAAPTRATWIAASGRRAGGPIVDTGLVYKKISNSCITKSAGKCSKTSSNISLRYGRTIVDSLELRVRGRYGGRGPARPTHMHDVCQHHRSSPLPSYRIAQLARMHAQIAHRACVCGGAPSECSSLPYISIYRCTSSLLLRGNVFYASPFDGIFSSWSD